MMQVYRSFTSKALMEGYSMASAAELWKNSVVRRTQTLCTQALSRTGSHKFCIPRLLAGPSWKT